MDNFFTDQDMKDCRDLCDKAKHLRLTKRPDPMTHKWVVVLEVPQLELFLLVEMANGSCGVIAEQSILKKLADRVLEKWKDFFERHQL